MRHRNRWCGASSRCSKPAPTSSAHAVEARPSTSARSERPWMKTKLCDVNASAIEKMPEKTGDKSGIGVHYVDAFIKPMNAKLEDGTAVKCKRRGLKITLTVG